MNSLAYRAPPLYIGRADLDPSDDTTLQEMQFILHPEQVREVISVEWTPVVVPGLSHTVLQYSHTENLQLERFSLFMARYVEEQYRAGSQGQTSLVRGVYRRDLLIEARNFLQQFCYPVGVTDGARRGTRSDSPPRALVVIPTVPSGINPGRPGLEHPIISMVVVFRRMETTYHLYQADGLMEFIRFDLELSEVRDVMLTSSEAAQTGSARSSVDGRPLVQEAFPLIDPNSIPSARSRLA